MKKDVSVIIVNYNTKKLTLKCLESIGASKPKVSYEVIIIDNNSDEKIDKSPSYSLIENKENLGFAKAVNQGIKTARGKYILLLNSDTEVSKGSIDKLWEFAERHPDAGAIGPKLINKDGSAQASAYNFPTIFRAIKEYWFRETGEFGKYLPVGDGSNVVDALVMAALMITPAALQKVGLLNERYFMYFEDMDFARRIKKSGLKVYYCPECIVSHVHGASGRNLADEKNQWRRLIPSSKIYHGSLNHYLVNSVLWIGQKLGKFIPLILTILLTIPAFYNLVRPGYFPMQDDLQAFRVYEMDKCFTDLQIPCRWVPDAGYQYGYPQFNFYPPLPYYLGVTLHRAGIQYIDSVKILFIAGYILSAIAMYILIRSLLGAWPGVVAATLYTYIPYKAVEVYVRGALSEFWSQIFFPVIFWSIYRLVRTGEKKYLVWLSLSVAFLATTHTLMTMIFIPFAGIWAIYWLARYRWQNLAKLVTGAFIGFALSAFFVLPVMFERQFAHIESLLSGYFDYRQHFVSLYKLFLSMEWGYGSSGFPNEKLNLSLGIIQWVTGLGTLLFAFFKPMKDRKNPILAVILSGMAIISIFMMHMKSSFIWAKLPAIWYLQFPWRFLAISIFLLCLLSGFAVYFSGRFKYLLGTFLIIAAYLVYIPFFVPKDWLNISDKEKFSGISWEKQLTISIFDYLPIYATLPPWQKAPDLPEVIKGEVKFISYSKGSDFQTGTVELKKDSTLRLPLFDFPGMEVKSDGNIVPHRHDDCRNERYCLGLITFDLPEGEHKIEARLQDTPVRKVGNFLTIAGIAATGYLVLKLRKK